MIHHPHSPVYNISTQYILKLINPISQEGSATNPVFYTTGFYIPNSIRIHYLDDDSNGNIRLYYLDDSFNKVIVKSDIGQINYELGEIVVYPKAGREMEEYAQDELKEFKHKVKEIIADNKNKPNDLYETLNYLNNYSGHS